LEPYLSGKRSVITEAVEFLTLTATLLLDGKAHIGSQFGFTISNTEPTFDTFERIMVGCSRKTQKTHNLKLNFKWNLGSLFIYA